MKEWVSMICRVQFSLFFCGPLDWYARSCVLSYLIHTSKHFLHCIWLLFLFISLFNRVFPAILLSPLISVVARNISRRHRYSREWSFLGHPYWYWLKVGSKRIHLCSSVGDIHYFLLFIFLYHFWTKKWG